MPYQLITEIQRPPSLYAKLTKGTFLEPWLWKGVEEAYYLHKPFLCWRREDGLFERVSRMSHIGFCIGSINGVVSGYMSNISRGVHGNNHIFDRIGWKHAGMGMLTGLLQSTVFTVTVTVLSTMKKQDENYFDWYFGGLSAALVTVVMSQQKNVINSQKWNHISLFAVPIAMLIIKYLRIANEFDDPKGGRYPGRSGGPQHHSPAELKALYGVDPSNSYYPIEMSLIKEENPEMLFLKPRQNPRWNDKWRTERDIPDSKMILQKKDYPVEEAVE